VTVCTTTTLVVLVQIYPVHGIVVDIGVVVVVGAVVGAVVGPAVGVVVGAVAGLVGDVTLETGLLSIAGVREVEVTRVVVVPALADWMDEMTLRTELVAVKEPVVISGTVPARLIVGVLVRPSALLSAVPTEELVLIAGVTEDVPRGVVAGGAPIEV
jgi:hypothetical protein